MATGKKRVSGLYIDRATLQAAFAAAGDIAFVWDIVSDRLDLVGDAAALFGARSAEAVRTGEAFNERIVPEDLTRRLHALSDHFAQRHQFDCEYRMHCDDGSFRWVHERGRADFSARGEPLRLCGTLRIIEGRKHAELQNEHLANFDALTGQFNAARLREALDHAMDYARRYRTRGGLVVVGVDRMAAINENYGHSTADAVLAGVGHRLERTLRTSDLLGRLDGDRFGIVLSNCSEVGIAAAAEKLVDAVRAAPIETPQTLVPVTVSAGAVGFPIAAGTAQDALLLCENVLLEAKKRGRDCAHVYRLSALQRDQQQRNARLGERVVAALRDDRIGFAYQPVVDTATGRAIYYETLLRMVEPSGRVVPASRFVPVAEKLGFMRLIDRRVLDLAMADLYDDPDIRLGLNISGLTTTDRSWLRGLVGLLKGRPDVAERLTVEITETAALQDFDDCSRFVASVRDLGCRVALDDFGAGYTSFRHLKTLAVDIIKIDGSFILDVASSPDSQLFIRTLLGFADGFGLTTVAEGVETQADADFLAAEGVRYLQGYHLGRPEMERPGRSVAVPAPRLRRASA